MNEYGRSEVYVVDEGGPKEPHTYCNWFLRRWRGSRLMKRAWLRSAGTTTAFSWKSIKEMFFFFTLLVWFTSRSLGDQRSHHFHKALLSALRFILHPAVSYYFCQFSLHYGHSISWNTFKFKLPPTGLCKSTMKPFKKVMGRLSSLDVRFA